MKKINQFYLNHMHAIAIIEIIIALVCFVFLNDQPNTTLQHIFSPLGIAMLVLIAGYVGTCMKLVRKQTISKNK
ncbi:hypothetical protein [Companilactobacillus mishanensis]|uniref:DUF3188 domain-containing protein n=1 Tax=Companilactobacillus mishanensis TaxID=2486008 RepID=A0A5P0ZGA1_9LACO|nr:hypothetical protein [Companilactobacillus mishanensis]MQS52083.1 hypothetical protein [Companilactobacillus mishanensis]